jgi:hypothetical protein
VNAPSVERPDIPTEITGGSTVFTSLAKTANSIQSSALQEPQISSQQSFQKSRTSSPQSKRLMVSNSKLSDPVTSPMRSPELKFADSATNMHARTLNLHLEQVLLMTMRREAVSGQIIYMENCGSELLNATNMVELICSRLSGKKDILNAISYLYSCFKRIQSKEIAATDKLLEDLAT